MKYRERPTHVKIYPTTKKKIWELKKDIEKLEGVNTVKFEEILRRTFNIPRIDEVLKSDAKNKGRFKLE